MSLIFSTLMLFSACSGPGGSDGTSFFVKEQKLDQFSGNSAPEGLGNEALPDENSAPADRLDSVGPVLDTQANGEAGESPDNDMGAEEATSEENQGPEAQSVTGNFEEEKKEAEENIDDDFDGNPYSELEVFTNYYTSPNSPNIFSLSDIGLEGKQLTGIYFDLFSSQIEFAQSGDLIAFESRPEIGVDYLYIHISDQSTSETLKIRVLTADAFTWANLGEGQFSEGRNWCGATEKGRCLGGQAPGKNQKANFLFCESCLVNLDQKIDVLGIDVKKSFNGTIKQSNFDLLFGNFGVNLEGGIFLGLNHNILSKGPIEIKKSAFFQSTKSQLDVQSGFSISSSESFSHQEGIIRFVGCGNSGYHLNDIRFYDFVFAKGACSKRFYIEGTLKVENDFQMDASGPLNGGTIEVFGNVDAKVFYGYATDSTIVLKGHRDQKITGHGPYDHAQKAGLSNLKIDKTGGVANFDGHLSLEGNFEHLNGNIQFSENQITEFVGCGGGNINSPGAPFQNLFISKHACFIFNIEGQITVNKLLKIDSEAKVGTGTILAKGDIEARKMYAYHSDLFVKIVGEGDQLITGFSKNNYQHASFSNLVIEKSSGIASFQGHIVLEGGFEYISGEHLVGKDTTFEFSGCDQSTLKGGAFQFENVNITKHACGTYFVSGDLFINGNLEFNTGTNIAMSGGKVHLKGNLSVIKTYNYKTDFPILFSSIDRPQSITQSFKEFIAGDHQVEESALVVLATDINLKKGSIQNEERIEKGAFQIIH